MAYRNHRQRDVVFLEGKRLGGEDSSSNSSNNSNSSSKKENEENDMNNSDSNCNSDNSSSSSVSSNESEEAENGDDSDDSLSEFVDNSACLIGKYKVIQVKTVNVLLFGRKGTGKSTFIRQLLNPSRGIRTRVSATRNPKVHSCIVRNGNVQYKLNLLDTPGLQELGSNPRDNRDLIDLAIDFMQNKFKVLNAMVFVSKAECTLNDDLDVLSELKEVIGNTFSGKKFLLLTHAEHESKETKKSNIAGLSSHREFRNVYQYCEEEVYFSGAITWDYVRQLDGGRRKRNVANLAKKVTRMREKVMEALFDCADKPKAIDGL